MPKGEALPPFGKGRFTTVGLVPELASTHFLVQRMGFWRAAVQERESELLRECWKSPEHVEAVKAFMEKRAPQFPPRS